MADAKFHYEQLKYRIVDSETSTWTLVAAVLLMVGTERLHSALALVILGAAFVSRQIAYRRYTKFLKSIEKTDELEG